MNASYPITCVGYNNLMYKNLAPLKLRFLALAIDYFIILGYALALLGSTLLFYELVFHEIPNVFEVLGRGGSQLLGIATLTLPIGLYLYLAESGRHHATLGKRLAKIQVTATSHKFASKKQIAIRTFVKLLPWEFAHTFIYQVVYYSQGGSTPPAWVMIGLTFANILPLVYLGMVLFRKDHRGPHDLVARTVVVAAR